jgi:hypothetical protein
MSNEEKKNPYGLTDEQCSAIRCLHADAAGAYQCAIRDGNGGADNGHDWKAHRLSVEELEEQFPDLLEHIPLEDGEDEEADELSGPDNAMSDDAWIEQYKPWLNAQDATLVEMDSTDEDWASLVAANRIWTLVDADGNLYITPGVHIVNRICHCATDEPWTGTTPDVAWHIHNPDEEGEQA